MTRIRLLIMTNLTLTLLRVMLLFSISFTSCSSEKNEKVGGSKTLHGTWKLVRVDGWEKDETHVKDDLTEIVDSEDAFYYTFKSDGSYREFDNDGMNNNGKYTFEDGILKLSRHSEIFNVIKLTSSTLVIEDKESYPDDYIKYTFSKCNER